MARNTSNIGVFNDLTVGDFYVHSNMNYVGDNSGTPGPDAVLYAVGDLVIHNGHLYECILEAENREPGATGSDMYWTLLAGGGATPQTPEVHNVRIRAGIQIQNVADTPGGGTNVRSADVFFANQADADNWLEFIAGFRTGSGNTLSGVTITKGNVTESLDGLSAVRAADESVPRANIISLSFADTATRDGFVSRISGPTGETFTRKFVTINGDIDLLDSEHIRLTVENNQVQISTQGIESGAQVNVQSDWNATDTTSDAFILNKPVLAEYTGQTEAAGAQQIYGVPERDAGNTTTKYLREDGDWVVPPDTQAPPQDVFTRVNAGTGQVNVNSATTTLNIVGGTDLTSVANDTSKTVTINHDTTTTATNTTAPVTITDGGTFTATTGVTVNNGHVTAVDSTVFTIPANPQVPAGTVPSNWSDVALDTELPDGAITFTGDVTGSVTPSPNAQSRALTVADEVRLDTRIPAWTQGNYVSNQTVRTTAVEDLSGTNNLLYVASANTTTRPVQDLAIDNLTINASELRVRQDVLDNPHPDTDADAPHYSYVVEFRDSENDIVTGTFSGQDASIETDRTAVWSGGGTTVDVIVDQMTDADAAVAAFNPGGTFITGIRTIVFSIGNVEVLRLAGTADFTSINDQGGNPRDIRFEGTGITVTGATVQTTFNWATITGLDSNGDPVASATFTAPSVQYFWAVPRTNVMFSPDFTGTYASVANSIFSFTAISDEWIAVGGSATTVNIGGGGGDVNLGVYQDDMQRTGTGDDLNFILPSGLYRGVTFDSGTGRYDIDLRPPAAALALTAPSFTWNVGQAPASAVATLSTTGGIAPYTYASTGPGTTVGDRYTITAAELTAAQPNYDLMIGGPVNIADNSGVPALITATDSDTPTAATDVASPRYTIVDNRRFCSWSLQRLLGAGLTVAQ